jgi:hypothetical protein
LQISDLNVPTRWFVFYLHGMTASAEGYSSMMLKGRGGSGLGIGDSDWGLGIGIGIGDWGPFD